MLTPAQADELIGQHLQCLPIESLPLAQCAGAVLRENVYAERDQPPYDRVAMDGVALEPGIAEFRTLHVVEMKVSVDERNVGHCGAPSKEGCRNRSPFPDASVHCRPRGRRLAAGAKNYPRIP